MATLKKFVSLLMRDCMWNVVAVSLVYKNRPLLIFPSHKIIVMIVNPVCCKEVWLGAGNPAGTIDQNCTGHPFPAPPPPHSSLADMRGEL
jgi:hypothetical protein